ncbi:MAG: lipid-A-disaccharide synthase [Gammaproteobacteria bacterium]|nr:lipid-A-disaccharide synthase [Gammaproteobacteria bacterium]
MADSTSSLTIAMVAGETSGDQLGASLISEIKKREPNAEFIGLGGRSMISLGFPEKHDIEILSVNGFFDPMLRLPSLIRLLFKLRREIILRQPDCFVGIDSNFFNLILAGMLKKKGIKTVQYVSPSIWAWREGRTKKIARRIDLVLTLYPFEAVAYNEKSVKAIFVGHPKVAEYSNNDYDSLKIAVRQDLGIGMEKLVLAILPGSRRSEVARSGRDFLETALKLGDKIDRFLIPAANVKRYQQLFSMLADYPELQGKVRLFQGKSKEIMAAADVVLVNSGTATLEAMLLRKPMIMSYRLGRLTHFIVSRLVKTKYFALPNILAGEKIIPEFIQNEADPERMAKAVKSLLSGNRVDELMDRYNELQLMLSSSQGEGREASEAVLAFCRNGIDGLAQ